MDSNYEIIDCDLDGWKAALLLKDSQPKSVCFGPGEPIDPKEIQKFRTRTTTTKGNHDLLSLYNFTDTPKVLELITSSFSIEKNSISFDLMQKSLFFYINQILKYDLQEYQENFFSLQKIFSLIFKSCIEILKSKTLKFLEVLDSDSKEDECVIWPEVFYYLQVIFRDPKKSEGFWEKHQDLIDDEELLNPRKVFLESMKDMKVKRLYRSENSLKFVYKLNKFFISQGLVGDSSYEEGLAVQKYWEKTFKALHCYLVKQSDFYQYKPKVFRNIFNQILKFLSKFTEERQEFVDVIQMELAKFDMKALNVCKTFKRKHDLVLDLDLSITSSSSYSRLCENLINFGFFSFVSSHRECIKSSKTFISYSLENQRENDLKFLEIFENLPLESMKEVVNIEMTLEKVQVSTVVKQIKTILARYDSSFQEIIIKLYWVKLKVTGNVEEFFKEVLSVGVTFDCLEKYLANALVFNDQEILKSLLFGMFAGKESLEFSSACYVLRRLDKDFLQIFDNNYQFFEFVFEKDFSIEKSEEKKVVFQIILEKSKFSMKKRIQSIIRFVEIDSSWGEFLCSMIEKKVIDSYFQFIFQNFFCCHQNFEGFEDVYISAYIETVRQSLTNENCFILNKTIEILFKSENATQRLIDELGGIVIELMIVKFYTFEEISEDSEILAEWLKTTKKIPKFFNFMRRLNECNLMSEGMVVAVLYSLLDEKNHEDVFLFLKEFPNYLSYVSEYYDPDNSNEYQDFLSIQNPFIEGETLNRYLNVILSKSLKFPKLSQILLFSHSENQIVRNSTRLKEICENIISSPLNQLDESQNVSHQLIEFFLNNFREYLQILVLKAIENPISKIYDPFEILLNILTEKSDSVDQILKIFTDSCEKLIISSNLKKITDFLLSIFNDTLEEKYENLVKKVFEFSVDNFEDDFQVPSLKLLNIFKFIYWFIKNHVKLSIFEEIIKKMKESISSETVFYPRSTELRGLFYKIFLKWSSEEALQMIEEKLSCFTEIRKNLSQKKMEKYSLCLKSTQKGLKREGMICYLNTILLLLNENQEFLNSLFSKYDPTKRNIDSLLYIFGKLRFSYISPVNGEKILKKNAELYFDEFEQRDASDFFNDLLESLSLEGGEDLKKTLEIEFSSNLLCDVCKTPNFKVNKEVSFMIDCNENQSISSKIGKFYENFRLEGENRYECVICAQKQNASQITTLKYLPETFIITIKRFTYSVLEGRTIKLNTKIGIEKEIDVQTEDQELSRYYLKGIIVHIGDADSGHYYYIKKESARWLLINDEEISIKPASSLDTEYTIPFCDGSDTSTPYIIIYSKRLEETELQLPDNINIRLLNKNLKYYKLSQFVREDFYEVVIQLVKQGKDYRKITDYLFLLSDVHQPDEHFIINSKRLLAAFQSIQDADSYIEPMISSLKSSLQFDYNQDHRSYIILEVLKTILAKVNPENHLKIYENISFLITSESLTDATFLFNLLLHLNFDLLTSSELPLPISPLDYFIENFSSTSLTLSSIFLTAASSEVLLKDFYQKILENMDFFLSNLPKSSLEPFAFLLSKYSEDETNKIIKTISSSYNPQKYPLLIHLLGNIFTATNECPFNYFNWILEGLEINYYPMFLKLAYKSLIPPLFKNLAESVKSIIAQSENVEQKIIQEIMKIFKDINEGQEIFIEFQGRSVGESFRDWESGKVLEIVDSFQWVVLVQDLETRGLKIKLLYHD